MTDLFGEPSINVEPLDGEQGRVERGAFYTPDPLARAICKTLLDECGIRDPLYILEPGCGGGAFLRAVNSTWNPRHLLGVDLQPACSGPGEVLQADLFKTAGTFDLVVGNPDFTIAEAVVRHCLQHVHRAGYVAFLLRAAFLGSTGRVALYREHPLRYLQPIAQRPSFTTDGKTDPMEYALFIWQQGFKGRGEILPSLVWR